MTTPSENQLQFERRKRKKERKFICTILCGIRNIDATFIIKKHSIDKKRTFLSCKKGAFASVVEPVRRILTLIWLANLFTTATHLTLVFVTETQRRRLKKTHKIKVKCGALLSWLWNKWMLIGLYLFIWSAGSVSWDYRFSEQL